MTTPTTPTVASEPPGTGIVEEPKTLRGSAGVTIIPTLEAFEAAGAAWDDLWGRSDRASPFLRADRVAAWCRRFAPGARFRAVTVADGDRLVAALPLVERRGTWPRIGQGPNNHWSITGDLLADAGEDPESWAPPLVEGIRRLPWSCLAYRLCPCHEAATWGRLTEEAARQGMLVLRRVTDVHGFRRLEPGRPDPGIGGSRKHRKNLERAVRQMEEAGGRLRIHETADPDEVDRRMREGLGIEDRGWKGRSRTSVLGAGMLDFFLEYARTIAARKDLVFYFLDLDGKPISFQYGCRGKDAMVLPKTAYDEEYARLSPGHVLTWKILEDLPGRGIREVVFGSLTESTARWATGGRPMGTVVLARRNLRGLTAFTLARALLAWKARRRRKARGKAEAESVSD